MSTKTTLSTLTVMGLLALTQNTQAKSTDKNMHDTITQDHQTVIVLGSGDDCCTKGGGDD